MLKYIHCVICERWLFFLRFFQSSSFADIDSVSYPKKRIERFLKKKSNIGSIEFFVIKIGIRVYHDSVPLFAVGRYTESESDKRAFRDSTDMFDKSAEIKGGCRLFHRNASFLFLDSKWGFYGRWWDDLFYFFRKNRARP